MEFLFLNHSSGVEALIVFLSIFAIIFLSSVNIRDWMQRKIIALNPRKAYSLENTVSDAEEINTPITLEEIENVEEKVIEESEGEKVIQNIESTDLSDGLPTSSEEVSTVTEAVGVANITQTDITGDSPEDESTGVVKIEEMTTENTSEEMPETPPKKSKKKAEDSTESRAVASEKREKLVEMVNSVKTLIARSHIDDARALIVNGLAIDKNHTELNLLMATLYERERSFEKAEFILKDVAEKDPDNIEVLTRLATVLAMQRKYEIAYEMYKKILSLAGETEEVLYTLTHLASEMSNSSDVYTYAKAYLRQYPKNPEILWLYSQSQIAAGERKGAVETLIKLKNLTPYNQEIVDLIGKLVTEEELAGNFGEEK